MHLFGNKVYEVISSLCQEDECIAAGGQHYLTEDETYFQRSGQNNEMLLLKIESILNVTVKKVKATLSPAFHEDT